MKTPLYDVHKQAGARVVDFAGWQMPVQYKTGIITEHKAVRTAAGLFDVSHMGQLEFRGPDAVGMVNRLITNDLTAIEDGRAQYTTICNDQGGILDDAISYRLSPEHVMMVVNASNLAKIDAWFTERASGDATYANVSDRWALLAFQGPAALRIANRVLDGVRLVPPFHVRPFGSCIVATTGYTGEAGFELFVPPDEACGLWADLLAAGVRDGALPVGLGARDTLRLDAKLCLYGDDIDETTNPIEAGLGWTVKVDKAGGFIGRDALVAIKAAKTTRRLIGIRMTERGIARHGYPISNTASESVGHVSSGTMSPTLGEAIAMAWVDKPFHKVGTPLLVTIRNNQVAAEVVKTPFYKRSQE